MVLANSPAGPIEPVKDLKRRQRSIYYRRIKNPDGTLTDWMPTALLPSDPVSKEQYLAKGFRLKPPSPEGEVKQVVHDTEKQELYAEIARLRSQLEDTKPKKGKDKGVSLE